MYLLPSSTYSLFSIPSTKPQPTRQKTHPLSFYIAELILHHETRICHLIVSEVAGICVWACCGWRRGTQGTVSWPSSWGKWCILRGQTPRYTGSRGSLCHDTGDEPECAWRCGYTKGLEKAGREGKTIIQGRFALKCSIQGDTVSDYTSRWLNQTLPSQATMLTLVTPLNIWKRFIVPL